MQLGKVAFTANQLAWCLALNKILAEICTSVSQILTLSDKEAGDGLEPQVMSHTRMPKLGPHIFHLVHPGVGWVESRSVKDNSHQTCLTQLAKYRKILLNVTLFEELFLQSQLCVYDMKEIHTAESMEPFEPQK